MQQIKDKTKQIQSLRILVAAAIILLGLLAGVDVDRYIVQFPAFDHMDLGTWAEYSRHADLGNGLLLYPVEAIGSFLLLLAASIIMLLNKDTFKTISVPLLTAVILAASGLLFSTFAAPVMLGVRDLGNDTELLRQAYASFYFWGFFRAIVQTLSFFAAVWTLARMHNLRVAE